MISYKEKDDDSDYQYRNCDNQSFISVIALIAGIVSAYLAIQEILTVHFTPPCYLRPLFPEYDTVLHNEKINCCGMKQNIYIFGNDTEMCRLSLQSLS